MECSFEEKTDLPDGRHLSTKCVARAEILIIGDPCYGLCYACAYKKIKAENKLLKAKLKNEEFWEEHCKDVRENRFRISGMKAQGLWASSPFGRSEMGLESLLRTCNDHEEIEIVIDEPIPGGGQSGLEKWLLKQGASKVTFKNKGE